MVDIVFTIGLLWMFFSATYHYVGQKGAVASFLGGLALAVACAMPLSVFFHALFQVPTRVNCWLGLSRPGRC
jgi:hypothetical protein